jgi:hypothetical protein
MGLRRGAGASVTIHDPQKFMNGLWDWAMLDGCFGTTRIRPTDIDGLVERHGNFLFLEAKSPGVALPRGQEITFCALARKPNNTIIVFWGDKTMQIITSIQVFQGGKKRDLADPSIDELRKVVSEWYSHADKQVAA